MTQSNVTTQSIATKPLIIGQAWDNGDSQVSKSGAKLPRMKVLIDRNLGFSITVVPGTSLAFWPSNKRTGINPKTNEVFQDPDYSVTVDLPAEIVDKEIARQKAVKESAASAVPTQA